MTNDYKELLLKYLTGNLAEEGKSVLLNYQNLTTVDQEYLGFNTPFSISGQIECVDTNNKPNGKVAVYGSYGTNDYIGFIALFEGTKLLFYTDQYNTGTKFGYFKKLEVDETGQFYGIDYFNEKFRFILLNNISELDKNGNPQIILRQSYYLQGSTQINEKYYSTYYVKKSPQSASYLIAVVNANYPYSINMTNFKINVGAPNEWLDFTIDLTFPGSIAPLNSYIYFDSDDNPQVEIYYTKYENTYNLCVAKNTGNILSTEETIITDLDTTFFGAGGMYWGGGKLLPIGKNSFYMFVGGTTNTGSYYYPKCYILDFKDGAYNICFVKNSSNTISLEEEGTNCSLFLINNLPTMYLTFPKGNNTGLFEQYVGLVPKYDEENQVLKKLPDSSTPYYQNISLFSNQFNIYNFSVIYTNEDSDLKLSSWKIVYNPTNYNNEPYENKNSLVQNNGLVFDTSNNLIFARNLYNYKVFNNRTNSILNIPNTYLNDITIAKTQILGETNTTLLEDTESITKNIYEDLYINFFTTLKMENQNEDIYIENKAGAIRLNQSSNKELDYENARASKIIITYSDGSTFKTSTSATITNGVATYEITTYIPNNKTITKIDILSDDEKVIYQTITKETINRLNLQNNKYYKITQDVHVE